MNNIIIVFRSRSDTLKFNGEMQKHRINAQIINTPKEAGKTCGISVKVSANSQDLVKRVLQSGIYPSFSGIYVETGGKYKN